MRKLSYSLLALALVAMVADTASAQRQRPGQPGGQRPGAGGQRQPGGRFGGQFGGGFGGGGMAGAALLANKSVQEELKMTSEQVEKVTALTTKMRESQTELFGKLRDLSAEERREKMQELQKEMREASEKVTKEAVALLTADQGKRFKQISVQVRGDAALEDTEVQTALKISEDQLSDIKKIREDMGREMREIFQSAQGDREGAQKKMETLRKETSEKILGTLSESQRKAFTEMKGEPFEIKFEQRRRPQ